MPRIPMSAQGQRLQPGSPVPIAGTGDARIPGEGVAALGKGLANLGIAMIDFRSRLKDTENKVQYEEAFTKAKDAVYQETVLGKQGYGADPGAKELDVYGQFMTNTREKIKGISETVDDPQMRRLLVANAEEYAQAGSKDLIKFQTGIRVQHAGVQMKDAVNAKAAIVYNNPALRDQGLVESIDFISQFQNDIIPADAKEKYINELPKMFDNSAIEGMKSRKEFDRAKQYMQQETVTRNYQPKELDQMLDSIDKAENASIIKDHQDIRWSKFVLSEQEKTVREQNDATYLGDFFNPTASAPKRQQLLNEAYGLFGNKLISKSTIALMEKVDTKVSGDLSDKTEFSFMDRLKLRKDLGTFESDIVQSVDAGNLDPKAGIRLLARFKDPKQKDDAKLIDKYEKLVKAPFATTITDDPTKVRELKVQQAAAVVDYTKMIREGITPEIAARNALKGRDRGQFVGVFSHVPEGLLNDPKMIDEELKKLVVARKKAEGESNKKVMGEIDSKINSLDTQRKLLNTQKGLQEYVDQAQPKEKPKSNFWQMLMNMGTKE